jgi:serine/threonine protein kinase
VEWAPSTAGATRVSIGRSPSRSSTSSSAIASTRKARAISALNHPNICTLYDVGANYLVMELVEGDTLAARLLKGPLAYDAVVRLGAQIADALAAAHAKRIVKRDLTPANVLVTRTSVKVLDFGVATFYAQPGDTATGTRAVVGTPAYMAPEQHEGHTGDARSDIFALGLVLYEMVTGKRALSGSGLAAPLDDILERLAHVIERCLARDPNDRWQSAADARRELEWAGKAPTGATTQVPSPRISRMWT